MSRRTRITVLVENAAKGRGMLGEHGLSYWIDTGDHRVLFDTGQTGQTLLHNTSRLSVNIAMADAVVLSHGHYDHTGGLTAVLGHHPHPRVLAHPAAFQRRYSRSRVTSVEDIGIPAEISLHAVRQRATVVETSKPTEIVPGLFVTGFVPRGTDYEDTGGAVYLDAACATPDPIDDDQAIYFSASQGTVVLLGCAHAGVINTLEYVRQLTGDQPIHAVIGGMHLVAASARRMDQTVASLRRLNVNVIAPTHCTGPAATARLWAEFPQAWRACPVSTVFDFTD
ncbi:MAG: MBL fold metallo-hydrolase [Phycisphaeraceae bacterium]|nr:MBL fold metallo-hydrolase [Phycisphaeraceae bacterium]